MPSIWSKKIIIPTVITAVFYVVATIYLMNAGLVKDTIFGSYSLSYKWRLLTALLAGMWTAMSKLSLFLLMVVAGVLVISLRFLVKQSDRQAVCAVDFNTPRGV